MTMNIHIIAAATALLASLTLTAQTGTQQAKEFGYPDTDGIYTYSGSKIELNRPGSKRISDNRKFTSQYIGKLAGRKGKGYGYQGMDIYGKYLLRCQNQGVASIYRFDGKQVDCLSQFELASFHADNHANVANFGTEFYAKGDPLPLIYISQAQKKTIKGLKDALYVERIAADLQSSALVQTIVFDDPDHLFGYALQWAIDKEDGFVVLRDLPGQTHPAGAERGVQSEILTSFSKSQAPSNSRSNHSTYFHPA